MLVEVNRECYKSHAMLRKSPAVLVEVNRELKKKGHAMMVVLDRECY